jgi:uridine phosphorylase
MKQIPDSQLVLTSEGAIYHLNLFPGQVADTIILVGDPARVARISAHFEHIELKVSNREINTHTGSYHGKRLTVMSTGMGPDNVDIVVNELDALFNVDFKTRRIKDYKTSIKFVRLGTSGALQQDIPVGESYVAAEYAMGLDGLLYFYDDTDKAIEGPLTTAFIEHMDWPSNLPQPYAVKASEYLLEKLAVGYLKGITATSPGFYGSQGRSIRLELAYSSINKNIESFLFEGRCITNFEMECSVLYGLSKMLGHEAVTICTIIANRVSEKFAGDYQPYMDKLINQTLDRLVEI